MVELPRPEGIGKIDLNEYLRDHTGDELRELMKSAKSILEILMDSLSEDFIKAQPVLRTEILPLLLEMDDGLREHYLDRVKKVKTSNKAFMAEFDEVKDSSCRKEESEERKSLIRR
ncbi:MAG: hypothetical protein U5J82_03475 [Desulfobacterales bacterium]|nr:hypothetical protein [Desulfobacterales bacterium]